MTDGVWSTLLCSGELTRRPARGRPHSLVWVFSTGPVGKRCRSTLTSGAELVAALLLSLCSGGDTAALDVDANHWHCYAHCRGNCICGAQTAVGHARNDLG